MLFTYLLLFQLIKYSYSIYAEFSSDIVSINLIFDGHTDKGQKISEFQCSDLLEFSNAELAKCVWNNDYTLIIYPGFYGTISLNDIIYTIPNTIKYCNDVNCNNYDFIDAELISIFTPSFIFSPDIILLLPDTSSYCSDVSMDITQSTGSGARLWDYIDIQIYKNNINEDEIASYIFDNKYILEQNKLVIPSYYFSPGTYSFNIIVCNFIGSCSSLLKNMAIVENNTSMSIYLGKDIVSTRNQPLRIDSELTIVECNPDNYIQPIYSWTLYELSNDKMNTNLKSLSKQPSSYILPTNTLKSNTLYTLLLTVTRNELITSSSININIGQGKIVTFIDGGNSQILRKGYIKRIDASGSYDEDNDNSNSGLIYDWKCSQIEGDICNYFTQLNSISYYNSYIDLFTNELFNNNTIITLTLSNLFGVKAVTQIIINTVSNKNPIITIDYSISSPFTNINTNKPFQIYGYIESFFPINDNPSWSSNVSNIELINKAIVTKQSNSNTQTQYIQLSINPYTLPSRTYFSFTLRSGDSFVSIVVNTNGPPIPGLFTLKPKYGIELTDIFTFNALYWTDENMPLTYSYGQIERNSFVYLETSIHNSYNTILSIGSNSNVTCFIIVEDSYGSSTNKTDFVILSKLSNYDAENIVISNLQQNMLELNPFDLQKTISLGTNVVNRYSCLNNCEDKQSIRNSLVTGVNNVIQLNNIDNKIAYNSAYSLNELSSDKNELTNETACNIINTVETLLYDSQEYSINYDSIAAVLQSVDSSLHILQTSNTTNITQLFNIFQNYNNISLNYKTPITYNNKTQGQNEIYTNFQISSGLYFYEPNMELIYPQTQNELNNNLITSVSINSINNNSLIQTSLIVPNTSFFNSNTTNWLTQPVYIETSENGLFTFTLPSYKNDISDTVWFNTTCDRNLYLKQKLNCSDGTILTHKCNGTSGIIVSACPILKPVCHIFDFEKNEFLVKDLCTTIIQNNNIICKCKTHEDSTRKLTNTKKNNNVIMVVAMSTYVASDIQNTFKQTTQLNIDSFNNARVALGIFSTIWGFGLILVTSYYIKNQCCDIDKIDVDINKKIKSAYNSKSTGFIRSNLIEYFDSILPHIFLKEKSYLYTIVNEIKRNHFYFKLLELWKNKENKYLFYTHLFNILTVLTMLLFFICLLYDTQCQNDDGSCSTYITKNGCLNKKALFDKTQTYCKWDSDNECVYKEQEMSLPTMVLIGFLVSIFSEIVSKPVDYLFDIIKSPSTNIIVTLIDQDIKTKIKETRLTSLKLINDFRMSNASAKTLVSNFNMLNSNKEKSIFINTNGGEGYILNEADEDNIELYCGQVIKMNEISKSQKTNSHETENEFGEMLYKQSIGLNTKLTNIVNRQRLLINREEYSLYDKQWGIDPLGELLNPLGITREINEVSIESNKIVDYLKNSTDYDKGIELVYLFVLDLLGRKTPEAKIFDKKFNEEHQRYSVVTNTSKRRALALIIGLNGFFIYYTFLHALLKGLSWQTQFLYSSIVQLLIEVCLFETIECIYINICIPSIVKKNVYDAYSIVFDLIDKICASPLNSELIEEKYNDRNYLSVPNILFVSTNVAKHYPFIIESVLVKSYNTYLPNKIASLWNNNQSYNNLYDKKDAYYYFTCAGIFLFTLGVFFMQLISTIPFMLQRIIVKFIQPVLLLCLINIYNLIIQNIYVTICLGLFLSGLTGRILYVTNMNNKIEKQNQLTILDSN